VEVNVRTKNFEQNVGALNQERENLGRKMLEYENRIISLTNEIERLNSLIRSKAEELQRTLVEAEQFKQNTHRKLQQT
jgi:peptidoglycan hydrolase CwlO-like protein